MANALRSTIDRPPADIDVTVPPRFRPVGVGVALVGLAVVVATLVLNALVVVGALGADKLRLAFGLTTTGFGTIKVGIAIILLGIILRLFMRVDAVKDALPRLKANVAPEKRKDYADIESPWGRSQVSPQAPGLLPPMVMARKMWAPMLLMGPALVLAGLGLSIAHTAATDPDTIQALGAWTQGTQFLGEAFLLAAISFVLGTILAGLRAGGGEVQESLGLTVKTLRLPKTGVFFILLMFAGLMLGVVQFILYGAFAAWADSPATWFAWLGPLRELSLGLMLAGIVLALVTIGTALGFQHWRIRQIIETGR